jgi:hypothetical protein
MNITHHKLNKKKGKAQTGSYSFFNHETGWVVNATPLHPQERYPVPPQERYPVPIVQEAG